VKILLGHYLTKTRRPCSRLRVTLSVYYRDYDPSMASLDSDWILLAGMGTDGNRSFSHTPRHEALVDVPIMIAGMQLWIVCPLHPW